MPEWCFSSVGFVELEKTFLLLTLEMLYSWISVKFGFLFVYVYRHEMNH